MLISEVALGKIYDTCETLPNQSAAPDGFDSVRGLAKSEAPDGKSAFEETEFCIFKANQQVLRFLVEFSLPGDSKPSNEPAKTEGLSFSESPQEQEASTVDEPKKSLREAGLFASPQRSGESEKVSLPLKAVHIRGLVRDLVAKITIFQLFTNNLKENCETKFVFPLSENSAVCGFEAFINDKHIVGIYFYHIVLRKYYTYIQYIMRREC